MVMESQSLVVGVKARKEDDFVHFALQEMEIHSIIIQIQTISMNLKNFPTTLHNPGTRRIFFPVNYPPQETNKEILQAREDLMEAIQAFLKEYDHIPPNEKCMALLLAEERFLKIKQAMEKEQNQPGVMQELLLKLMDDLQILKGSQQEKEKTAAQSFTPYWNFSMIDDEEARENFMKDICTFLRKFSRIPFGVTPKVILIAWERFGKIKHALTDKQYRQEDIQELMSKLLEDVRNISEELSEYINCPSWNRPIFYDNDNDEYTIIYRKPAAITPDLPIEEPNNSLIMGDELRILSQSQIVVNSNDDDTSSDNDDFEDIEYIEASPSNVILREKLFNINRLIANIEFLNDNTTPNCVLKSPSPFPIPDSNSFFEKSDYMSLLYSDNSFRHSSLFSDHTGKNGVVAVPLFLLITLFPEIPQDHEDPCLFSILQSSGLQSFAYFGILNPDHVY
ncbi:hypothetical protein Tco_0222843 [Tanacetum coccineum]